MQILLNNINSIQSYATNIFSNSYISQNIAPSDVLQNDIIDLHNMNNSNQDNQYSTNRSKALQSYLTNQKQPHHVYNEDQQTEKTNANPQNHNNSVSDNEKLSEEDQKEIEKLKQRNDEVVTHENQHKTVAGNLAQTPSYTYTTGPDGKRYISDGEVSIDVSKEKDPNATITKMQTVKRAALAPSEPSSADRNVARRADAIEAQARKELQNENQVTINSAP